MEGQRGPPSSLNKSRGSKGTAGEPEEESGWTQYLMDFSSDQKDQRMMRSSFSNDSNYGSPSMVSDAASPSRAAPPSDMSKFNRPEGIACSTVGGGGGQPRLPKKLKVKKQRTKKYYYDDLEDTASSPVNSPKVTDSKHTDIMDDSNSSFQGEKSGPPFPSDERSSIVMDGKNREEDCSDLKKKGLCLMPFSMFVNYLH